MSLEFNGTTSVCLTLVDAILRPVLPVTLAAWIRPDSLKACGFYQTNKNNTTHRGAWMNMNSVNGDVECGYGDNGGNTSADRRTKLTVSPNLISANVWTHLAATIRGATDQTIYIDGVDAGGNYSGTGGGMAYDASVAGRIGASSGTPNFDGLVADLAFWNVSLSTAEVLSMAKGVAAKMVRPASLLGNWAMWNASNPSVDLSQNSLDIASMTAVTAATHAPVGCPYAVAT